MILSDCVIVSKKNLAGGIYDFWLKGPAVASARPGQFVDIRCGNLTLRRPISICETDPENGLFRIVFEIRGEGTKILASKNEGDRLDVLGPLGNGFEFPGDIGAAALVGGGIGTPPMLGAAKLLRGKAKVFLGFRNADSAILAGDFALYSPVEIATEDGSLGHRGFVTGPLREFLESGGCGAVYACGPSAMLKAVSELSKNYGARCFVSMEQRMACGVGACLCCAVKTKDGGREKYQHVCRHGPVFDSENIVWSEVK